MCLSLQTLSLDEHRDGYGHARVAALLREMGYERAAEDGVDPGEDGEGEGEWRGRTRYCTL